MSYSNDEKMDMLKCYTQCNNNATAAVKLTELYGDRTIPSRFTFSRIQKNLLLHGSFNKNNIKSVRCKRVINEKNTIMVLAHLYNNPHTSLRIISAETGITYSSCQKIAKLNKFHDYKIQLIHHLRPTDFERRLYMVAQFLTKIDEEPDFLTNILWTDESQFTNNGMINRHNSHYWSDANPHWTKDINFQVKWGVNVWCGILGGILIGPYFFDGTLTGIKYRNFLNNEIPKLLENVSLEQRLKIYYHQDGAPAHNSNIVRECLTEIFGVNWIGTYSPEIKWPARSPDLTPLDFFLWGFLKEVVYITPSVTIEELKSKIVDACASIPREMLLKVTQNEVLKRMEMCLEVNGQNFEHLIKYK